MLLNKLVCYFERLFFKLVYTLDATVLAIDVQSPRVLVMTEPGQLPLGVSSGRELY